MNAKEALKLLESKPRIEISVSKEKVASVEKSITSLQAEADSLYKQWTELVMAENHGEADKIKEKYDAVCLVIDALSHGSTEFKRTGKAEIRDYAQIDPESNSIQYSMYA